MSTLTAQATVGPGMWQGMPSASCGACSALTASRWHSNNSVFATLGMDYGPVVDKVVKNGEPGFAWLENMQQFSRMSGEPDHKDHRAGGGNPCLEQTLESYELCCLVETFPSNHESFDDFRRTLKVCARVCVALLSLCTTVCVSVSVPVCLAATLMRGGMQLCAVCIPVRQDRDSRNNTLARHQPCDVAQSPHRMQPEWDCTIRGIQGWVHS